MWLIIVICSNLLAKVCYVPANINHCRSWNPIRFAADRSCCVSPPPRHHSCKKQQRCENNSSPIQARLKVSAWSPAGDPVVAVNECLPEASVGRGLRSSRGPGDFTGSYPSVVALPPTNQISCPPGEQQVLESIQGPYHEGGKWGIEQN